MVNNDDTNITPYGRPGLQLRSAKNDLDHLVKTFWKLALISLDLTTENTRSDHARHLTPVRYLPSLSVEILWRVMELMFLVSHGF